MTWKIELSEEAVNFLDYLHKADKKALLQIRKKLEIFSQQPRQFGKPLTGNKQGLWRYRVGDYRILCQLQEAKLIILALEIGHRKDIYE
jgi:mRNA interferase RelE/StbE